MWGFLVLLTLFCSPLEGVTTSHRAWVSAWKAASAKGIDAHELALASILEKTLTKDSAKVEEELLQTPDSSTNPEELVKAAQSAMTDLHRLGAVQSVQQDTQECCAAHRIGSLDDLSRQATEVLQKLGAAAPSPLTHVLNAEDEALLSGKRGGKGAGKGPRGLWAKLHQGKGKAKWSGHAKGGKAVGKPHALKLVPVEIEGDTVEADTGAEGRSRDAGAVQSGGSDGSDGNGAAAGGSTQTTTTSTTSSTDNVSPSVVELKTKIGALIDKIRSHAASPQGLNQSIKEGKDLMNLYKQVKSATELELLKYTTNTKDIGSFPVEADDVIDSPLQQDAASWGVPGGIVADWITPGAAANAGGSNEYNANVCCDLNGNNPPADLPTSSSASATPTPTPAASSSAVAPAAVSSSTAGGDSLLQNVPGLGQIHVFRIFPREGAAQWDKVTPGSVPGQPGMITLPGDLPFPKVLTPAENALPSSDGLVKGVRFEEAVAAVAAAAPAPVAPAAAPAQVEATSPAPAPAAATPAGFVASALPAGMIAPAIDPSLHLSAEEQFSPQPSADAAAGLVHPAVTDIPFTNGLVQATYDPQAAAFLQQAGAAMVPNALLDFLNGAELKAQQQQEAAKPMTPAEMLKLELDMLRKQMNNK